MDTRIQTVQRGCRSTFSRLSSYMHNPEQKPVASSFVDRKAKDEFTKDMFWWKATGLPFSILLEKAGYSLKSQKKNLLLYHNVVASEIGPGPTALGFPQHWRSFMTDHFNPVEFSWEWNIHKPEKSPTIRYSFEPIGPRAGTVSDPYNQHAAQIFIRKHRSVFKTCNLRWFKHFQHRLLCVTPSPLAQTSPESEARTYEKHKSSTFLAFDFGADGPILKAYFMPLLKAQSSNCTSFTVIEEAMNSLPSTSSNLITSFDSLRAFLAHDKLGSSLRAEILGIDCIEPETSRIKIYMRTSHTSFDSVARIMCVGNLNTLETSEKAIGELRRLWYRVFELPNDHSNTDELSEITHYTSGILYYFELSSNAPRPRVKVYLPVRHYGRSDLAVACALQHYINGLGRPDLAAKYVEALNQIRSSSVLNEQGRVQTYISCAFHGNQLRITSYLAPVVFRTGE